MENLGGENLDRETPFSVGKDVFTSFTRTTCLSLFFQMRTEGGAGRLLERSPPGRPRI